MTYTYALDYVFSPAQTPDDAPPAGIIIHHWGAMGQTHDGVVSYLTRPGATTSAHYVASAGRVTCLVAPEDTAWHAGTWPSNVANIGIECRPEMSEGDMETVAELIAWLRGRFGPLPLSGHRDHYPTSCPGLWYDQMGRISTMADAIRAGTYIPQEEELNSEDRKRLHEIHYGLHGIVFPVLSRLDRARVEEAARDTAMSAALEALAKANGLDPTTISAAIEAAVERALKGLTVTLTTEEVKA